MQFFGSTLLVMVGLFAGFFLLISAFLGLVTAYQHLFSDSPPTAEQWSSWLRDIAVASTWLAVFWGLFGAVRLLFDPRESPWRGRSRQTSRRATSGGRTADDAESAGDGATVGDGEGRRAVSAAGLPWPEEWSSAAARMALFGVLLFLALAMLGVGSAMVVTGSDLAGGAFVFSVGLLLLAIGALGGSMHLMRVRRGSIQLQRTGPDGSTGSTGSTRGTAERATIVPFSRHVTVVFVVLILVFGVVGALMTVIGLSSPALFILALGLLFLVLSGWATVEIARGRLRRGRLVLTPFGIAHHSWASGASVSWDALIEITPLEMDNAPHVVLAVKDPDGVRTWRTSRVTHAYEQTFAPHVPIALQLLGGDPALIHHAMRYYLWNPEARTELGSDAATARIRSGDVVVDHEREG